MKAAKKTAALAAGCMSETVAKRASAYVDMEPHLRDCQRWAHLAESLTKDDDPAIAALVAEHAADEIDRLVSAYYAASFAP